MIIKTKFKPGDKAYVVNGSEIKRLKITFVDVFVGDGTKGKVIIRYGVREIVGYIPEERCFANKEELVKAI
jgi:hypothetical protein